MNTRIKRWYVGDKCRRVITLFLALSLTLVAWSFPLPVAAERVIGQGDASYGASEIPAEGQSSACDVNVIIVDKLSRYAVDLTYDAQSLLVFSSGLYWDVNSLDYVLSDPTVSDTAYSEHLITMHLCNRSDLAVTATGTAVQTLYGFGYTLEAPGTVTVPAATPMSATELGTPGVQTLTFMLRVPSLTAMTQAFIAYIGNGASMNTLGTLTVRVGEAAQTP
ncbi:MAG: hypothetical protein J6R04_03780 [Clostridia bacterium]|nr:hypothetical protein [Clostridia bacterium]